MFARANHEEADEYARERGGYCQGLFTHSGAKQWFIFTREFDTEDDEDTEDTST